MFRYVCLVRSRGKDFKVLHFLCFWVVLPYLYEMYLFFIKKLNKDIHRFFKLFLK